MKTKLPVWETIYLLALMAATGALSSVLISIWNNALLIPEDKWTLKILFILLFGAIILLWLLGEFFLPMLTDSINLFLKKFREYREAKKSESLKK